MSMISGGKWALLKLIAIVVLPLFVLDYLSGRSYPTCVPNETCDRTPDSTTSGQEPLCGTGFLAMLSCHTGEDRHPIVVHHHRCPAAVCAACTATSCHGGALCHTEAMTG